MPDVKADHVSQFRIAPKSSLLNGPPRNTKSFEFFSKYLKITEKWVSDQEKLKDSKYQFRFLN
jgi:hypothetical protein